MKRSVVSDFVQCVAVGWAFALFVSALIVGFYYLPDPWSWVCAVFLFVTAGSVFAFFAVGIE